MILTYLLKGIGLGLYAGIMPGPTQAFILAKTVKNGWRNTLSLAFVPLVSDLPIALAFCTLLSTLPEVLIGGIQLIGGFYLLYLGRQTWKTAGFSSSISEGKQEVGFWQTVGINLLNPNVYIFWLTVGAPIVIEGWRMAPDVGISFIIGMYFMLVLTMLGFIIIFDISGKLPVIAQMWIIRLLGLVLFVLGFYQVWSGFHSFFLH